MLLFPQGLLSAWLQAQLFGPLLVGLLWAPWTEIIGTAPPTVGTVSAPPPLLPNLHSSPDDSGAPPRVAGGDDEFHHPCESPSAQRFEYCDQTLSHERRITSLLYSLTPTEKLSLLGNNASSVPRLSLPRYEWWGEALHGVASWCCPYRQVVSTSFPQVCAISSSFNRTLFENVGDAIGYEGYDHFWVTGDTAALGVTFWAPNVNIFRDPRWGRGQETPGEDPYLTSEYAAALIPAMQYGLKYHRGGGGGGGGGDGVRISSTWSKSERTARNAGEEDDDQAPQPPPSQPRARVAAACKHYAAYSIETGRASFDAELDPRDWDDTYSPAFRTCVESGALGIMCSYNSVDGVPSCANSKLLKTYLREDWGFDGYVTGDCDAVGYVESAHHYAHSPEEAVAMVIKAGVDVDCGRTIQSVGEKAMEKGMLTEKDVDGALGDLLRVQFRLGLFDPPPRQGQLSAQSRRAARERQRLHNDLALEAARQAVVLLKNGRGDGSNDDGGSARPLPLSRDRHASVALIGPNADARGVMQGNYAGIAPFLISPKQGLEDLGVNVTYHKGCNVTSPPHSTLDPDEADAICHSAAASDATVLIVGLDQSVESEGRDRTDLSLPGHLQDEIISLAAKCAKEGGGDDSNGDSSHPVVLVVMAGSPVDLSPYKESESVDAILHVGYPGQSGGIAIAESLYGKYNPSGRLTTTIYPNEFVDQVAMGDMRMRPSTDGGGNPGRTHRFYTGKAVYPFGFGLSYSRFEYCVWGRASADEIAVEVSNLGPMDGSHSVLLFHSGPDARKDGNPIRSLVGFEKIFLMNGERAELTFVLERSVVRMEGKHTFYVGNDQGSVHEAFVAGDAVGAA